MWKNNSEVVLILCIIQCFRMCNGFAYHGSYTHFETTYFRGEVPYPESFSTLFSEGIKYSTRNLFKPSTDNSVGSEFDSLQDRGCLRQTISPQLPTQCVQKVNLTNQVHRSKCEWFTSTFLTRLHALALRHKGNFTTMTTIIHSNTAFAGEMRKLKYPINSNFTCLFIRMKSQDALPYVGLR